MEFVGRTLRKEFRGFGTFSGTVESYDASSKFFKVVYEDGDSEELELSELAPLFQKMPRGRRRRGMARARQGNACSGSGSDCNLRSAVSNGNRAGGGECVVSNGSFMGSINVNVPVEEAVAVNNGDSVSCNGHVQAGFDLNERFSLNDGCNLSPKEGVIYGNNCEIDLNLDAASNMDENSREGNVSGKKEGFFDLNLEIENGAQDTAEELGQSYLLSPPLDNYCNGVAIDVEVKFTEDYIAVRTLKRVDLGTNDLTRVQKISASADLAFEGLSLFPIPVEVICEDIMDSDPSILNQNDLGTSPEQGSECRRKRKVMDSAPGMVLRRSARKGTSKYQHLEIVRSTGASHRVSSPATSVLTEKKLEDICDMPPILDLPPPSRIPDLDGISVFDIFSVYSCLRSFSTLLFLSPFDLGNFVSALRSEHPDTLFDCIHVALLQTLRKHLEHLASEGSAPALHCLRSLNWDFLDLITWPVFLAEYLLLHDSLMQLSELSSLKLLSSDYYKQPISVKLDILRYLCDEVIEADVIRSEINSRSLGAEPDIDFDQTMSAKTTGKSGAMVGNSGRAYISDELTEDNADWNSDECCLCKMDGNLICCDGCPAAYHSKCVGIVSDLLPEGDWYCPECVIEINKSQIKQCRLLQGAELLGFDPHKRLYFGCFDYLLVSDSCKTDVSYKFYHKSDLISVIEVLKSSEYYSDLLKTICMHWDMCPGLAGTTSGVDSVKCITQKRKLSRRNHPATSFAGVAGSNAIIFSNTCKAEDKKLETGSLIGGSTDLIAGEFGKDPTNGIDTLCLSSEGSAEISMSSGSQVRGGYLATASSAVKLDNTSNATPSGMSLTLNRMKEDASALQCGTGYVNCYSFGKIAAPVVEELLQKVQLNEDVLLSDEEIISQQMRAISKNVNRFCWPNEGHIAVQNEKCGWCFPCRTNADEYDCLFNTYMGPLYEGSDVDISLLQSSRNKGRHFIGVVGGILSIENRLHGLLSGPWLNSQYTEKWRKSALEASDLATIKSLLIKLASNAHHLAIADEWKEYEDSALVLGSASHVVTTSTYTSSKHGPGRKRGRPCNSDSRPSSSSSGPGLLFYWRGGRLSRHLFSWKVVPRSLASKAARQGGSRKIPGILYPDNSDFARRSRYLSWMAAVESSTSIFHLALQVREFDSNIKWDDIENTDSLSKIDKEVRKSLRAFKKVIIRRKAFDGNGTKYLLDFGKRRAIPDVVMKHGSPIEESCSERKRYWLNEYFLPLHILKSYEEKRIARISNKTSSLDSKAAGAKKKRLIRKMPSANLPQVGDMRKKLSRERGFTYLFSRAERMEYSLCGHCKKDVLTREAVSCQFCEGMHSSKIKSF
ncbi:hypothetical protein SAY86_031258 [Trapa natans]|uniref:Uncharacterized protein n=1 Tax=Trapa natans TaxID=22666 RepID=A0AAN7LRH0_TRANT|nr:hypothetical protein SAY86_031258 [Trapa natans]